MSSIELNRIEEELLKHGLHQTLEAFRSETQRAEAPSETESRLEIQSAKSEPQLAPLTLAQPVYSEPTQPLFKTKSADCGLTMFQQPSPRFEVIPIPDQTKFKIIELSSKSFADKTTFHA